MFFATPFIGVVALLSRFTAALPRPDSAVGDEVAVSAPNGIIMSDTAAPATQTANAMSTMVTSVGSGSSQASAALATAASSPPTYGSGGSNWGNPNYSSCVQQCMASHGGLPASSMPPTATSVSNSGSSGSSGSAATHTVIVAPTQGVLRYIPFALNASVGDTIQFMWGANNHTVTKSSVLTPCNKTSDKPFSSGEQNKGFVFTQVVNDTNPTFFYCGTPTHCEKGMFGIINPPNALGSPTSASNMMQPLAAAGNNSNITSYIAYTNSQTANNSAAASWGGGIEMSSLPTWSHDHVAENILYTRTFLAANSKVLQQDGTVNLGSAGSNPQFLIPKDLSAAVNSTGASSSATSPVPSASSTGSSASMTNAAISASSSKVLLGLVVGLAAFMMS